MATNNLGASELANGSANYLLANEAFDFFDRAIAGRLTIDFASDANLTLSVTAGSEEWLDAFLTFTDTGVVLTAARDVIFPAENGPVYLVKNSTAQTLTCKLAAQTGVDIASGGEKFIYNNGTDIAEFGATAVIADDSITNTKLANVATGTIKGRLTASTGDPEDLTASQVRTLINADRKNAIINGNFAVNQRGVSGTVTLAAGVYGHDRWKAGASGCTYTFATSANVTTLTITAGSLIQVIEGVNLFSGTYVLSWVGTAQGKIGAGSYSASGVTGSATGGTNLNIEFNTGTLSKVQFEQGSVVTDFERRTIGEELALCKRYYQRYSGDAGTIISAGFCNGGTILLTSMTLSVEMRAAPTMETSGTASNYSIFRHPSSTTALSAAPIFELATSFGGRLKGEVASGLTGGQAALFRFNVTTYLGFDAEL